MDNAHQWSVIVGAVLPLVIAVIVQSHWSSATKSLVALLACCVAGVGVAYFNGQLITLDSATGWASDIMFVLIAALALYGQFYKRNGITDAIEQATNLPRLSVRFVKSVPPTSEKGEV